MAMRMGDDDDERPGDDGDDGRWAGVWRWLDASGPGGRNIGQRNVVLACCCCAAMV